MKAIVRLLASVLAMGALVIASHAAATEKAPVKFTLDWLIGGRHAGWFTAFEKGFYDEENLAVTISRGFGLDDGLRRLVTGDADVNFNDVGLAMLFRHRDNVPIKSVAVVYGKHPGMIFTLKNENISKPKDLEGKTLTESPGSVTYQLFPAYAKLAGFDPSTVKWVIVPPDAKMQLLLAGKADGTLFYSMQLPVLEKATASKGGVNTLAFGDYLKLYSNGVLVNDRMTTDRPDVLKRFLRASMKGWEYAFSHKDEATQMVLKQDPLLDPAVTRAEIDIVEGLAMTPEAKEHGIGYMDPEKMRDTRDLIFQLNDPKGTLQLNTAYTNEFLPGK
jgi:NitT/TauT family transport system substrate-binding protein